jgi:hypothetical protein
MPLGLAARMEDVRAGSRAAHGPERHLPPAARAPVAIRQPPSPWVLETPFTALVYDRLLWGSNFEHFALEIGLLSSTVSKAAATSSPTQLLVVLLFVAHHCRRIHSARQGRAIHTR